jgi:hypothetical protein
MPKPSRKQEWQVAIDFTDKDDQLVEQYVATVLHRFKDGAVGFEEALGDLVAAIDLIARDDPSYRTYLQASIDGGQ